MSVIEKKIIDIGHEIFKGYGVQRTGYSLASISLKIKNIEQFWSIKRMHKPGSRKTYLLMEKDLLDIFDIQIRNGFVTELEIAKTKMPPLIEEYRCNAFTQEQKTKLTTYENYLKEIKHFEELIQHIYDQIAHLKKNQV